MPEELFTEQDYARFSERLRASILALERILDQPGFGRGPATIGAELELDLAHADGRPFFGNATVRDTLEDPRITLELGRFNLEINSTPVPLEGRPFSALAEELLQTLKRIDDTAQQHDAFTVLIGILPTLTETELGGDAISDSDRYRRLNEGLRRLREEPFRIDITGREHLVVTSEDVSLEAANTSFQLHLRVEPNAFADIYNAAQLATAPALAVAGNSPLLFGRRLWHETRIALFQQSVDPRGAKTASRRFARVAFGSGWVRRGALELFAENVGLHEPIMPELSEEEPLAVIDGGGTPQLAELRLHQGTTWSWNRAIYDPAQGGHLRIEMRALPSGPTVEDTVANAAFLLGLVLAFAPDMSTLTRTVRFSEAHRNFYRAAREGLSAELRWPSDGALETVPAADLALRLLPIAREGLLAAHVAVDEVDHLLGVVRARVISGQTGAVWQLRVLDALEDRRGREEALRRMVVGYVERVRDGRSVAVWQRREGTTSR